MGNIHDIASERWKEMSAEFDAAVEAQFQVADQECNGYLVNKRGKLSGASGWSLFTGSSKQAYLYASEELVAFWELVPRLDKNKFERQWCSANGYD